MIKQTICIAKYDLKIFFRYTTNILWMVITPIIYLIIGIAVFGLVGEERFFEISGGCDSGILYVLMGNMVFTITTYCWQIGNKIESEIMYGTVKTNFLLPISRKSYVMGLCFSTLVSTGIFSFVFFIIGCFAAKPDIISLVKGLIAFMVYICYLIGISQIMSGLALLYKKIGNLSNMLTFLLEIISGMMIPINAFPAPLRYVCYVAPTTWGIDCVRSSILRIAPIKDYRIEMVILIVVAIISNLLGEFVLEKAERKMKKEGLVDMI